MKAVVFGTMIVLGLAIGISGPSFAAGDGLDRNAGAQGNGRTGKMVTGARRDSRAAMRGMKHRRRMAR